MITQKDVLNRKFERIAVKENVDGVRAMVNTC